jgi:hypothetical protein
MFEASAADSAMRSAILATAYADLAVSERHGEHGMASHRAYFGTIRRLQQELALPDFTASKYILAAVLAIDAYEVCCNSKKKHAIADFCPAFVPGQD